MRAKVMRYMSSKAQGDLGLAQATHSQKIFDQQAANEAAYVVHHRNRIDKLLEILGSIEPKEWVADLGCFTAAISELYLQAGARVVEGFDVAEAALEVARLRGVEARPWNMEAEPAPVEDGRYDVVVASEVIEHLVDTDHFLREAHRILKPGGRLVLSTVNLGFWLSRLLILLGRSARVAPGVSLRVRLDPRIALEHVRIGHLREWRFLVEQSGFEVERVEVASPFPASGLPHRFLRFLDRALSPVKSLGYWIFIVARKTSGSPGTQGAGMPGAP